MNNRVNCEGFGKFKDKEWVFNSKSLQIHGNNEYENCSLKTMDPTLSMYLLKALEHWQLCALKNLPIEKISIQEIDKNELGHI